MEQSNLNKKEIKIEPSEFNPVNANIKSKTGGMVIGATFKLNGTWVLIQKEDGALETRPLGEVVSALDPNWMKIEKIGKNPRTNKLPNIRPVGDYSHGDKREGNM